MRVIVGALVWLIILLLLGLPLLILTLVRSIVTLFVCCCGCGGGNGGKLRPLNTLEWIQGIDSSWIKPLINVGFLLEVGGNVEVAQFRAHFEKCFNLGGGNGGGGEPYEGFYSYLVKRGGYVFRASSRASLNLEENIVERELEGGESLEEFLARWSLERSYGERKACWEICLLKIPPNPSDTSRGRTTAIAIKIHHGLCDGYSFIHILDKLLGSKSPYLVQDFKEGFWGRLRNTLEGPLNMRTRMGGMGGFTNHFKVTLEKRDQWIFSFASFPLEDMKKIRRQLGGNFGGGAHMVSVIYAIIIGALRRLLLEEDGGRRIPLEEIPERIIAGFSLPWPRHPAMVEGAPNSKKICNHWTSDGLRAPLREPDPVTRLQLIEQDYRVMLSCGLDKFVRRATFPMTCQLPPVMLAGMLEKDSGMPCALTSLIGADSYNLLGYPVERVHPFLTSPDNVPFVPLSNFTFSHSGRMELTMGANPQSIFKDQKTLDRVCHEYTRVEFEQLLKATN